MYILYAILLKIM